MKFRFVFIIMYVQITCLFAKSFFFATPQEFFCELTCQIITGNSVIPYSYRYMSDSFNKYIHKLYLYNIYVVNFDNKYMQNANFYTKKNLISLLYPNLESNLIYVGFDSNILRSVYKDFVFDNNRIKTNPITKLKNYRLYNGMVSQVNFDDLINSFYLDFHNKTTYITKDSDKIIRKIYDSLGRLLLEQRYINEKNISDIKMQKQTLFLYNEDTKNKELSYLKSRAVMDFSKNIFTITDYDVMRRPKTEIKQYIYLDKEKLKAETINNKDVPDKENEEEIQEEETEESKISKQLEAEDKNAGARKAVQLPIGIVSEFIKLHTTKVPNIEEVESEEETTDSKKNEDEASEEVTDNETENDGDSSEEEKEIEDKLIEEKKWSYDKNGRVITFIHAKYDKVPNKKHPTIIETQKNISLWQYRYIIDDKNPDYRYYENGILREEVVYITKDSYKKTDFFEKGVITQTVYNKGEKISEYIIKGNEK